MTIEQIQQINCRKGFYFFSPDTMRFFRSRVLSQTFPSPHGVYFVTSEQFVGSDGHKAPRRFTVRAFNPESGDIHTVQPFNSLARSKALRIASKLAEEMRLVAWG